ncbi:unnamed protein product [Blepharisma stoltei]|uniref:F-BAR domain-containing protein n=1 Tax=Blepharisma stoltei TaxID=1481888 RepID=A0AAU9IW16_9CILI|nr:unnamed protein product [Blepharisma stoltei]
MSFSESLHDKFDIVHKHALEGRKGGEEFIQLLRERVLLEEAYSKGLDRLGTHPFRVATKGTLSHAIEAMKGDCLNRASQSKSYIDNVTSDLIDPLKDLLNTQRLSIKKMSTEGKRLEKEKLLMQDKIEKSHSKYIKACAECEQLTVQLDQPSSITRSGKLIQKLYTAKQELDSSLIQHVESIDSFNEFYPKYCDTMAMVLEVYQNQEEQRLESMKDALRKLVVYEASYIRNIQYDIDSLAKAMESINPIVDLKEFIDDNVSENPKAFKYVFQPYESNHPSFKGGDSRMFSIKNPFIELSAETKELYKQEIEEIISKSWAGDANKSDLQRFGDIIKYPVCRETFCNSISQRKTPNTTSLSEPGFIQMGELMLLTLNECKNYDDIKSVRSIIYLSQSFHKDTEGPAYQWEYLQTLIKSHSVWSSMEFWERIIQSSIDEDIKNYEDYGIVDGGENEEETGERLKNIVFCQLGAFGHIMVGFEVDTMYAAELVSKYACRYQLPSRDIDTLMATIDKDYKRQDDAFEEPAHEVLRGVPDWLQELEMPVSMKRTNNLILSEGSKKPTVETQLTEQVSQDNKEIEVIGKSSAENEIVEKIEEKE